MGQILPVPDSRISPWLNFYNCLNIAGTKAQVPPHQMPEWKLHQPHWRHFSKRISALHCWGHRWPREFRYHDCPEQLRMYWSQLTWWRINPQKGMSCQVMPQASHHAVLKHKNAYRCLCANSLPGVTTWKSSPFVTTPLAGSTLYWYSVSNIVDLHIT